jgi:uncharacterized membrane protein
VTILGCASDLGRATVYGISDGQVVVGSSSAGGAAVWQPGSCRENLPPLIEGRSSGASAVSGDGTIVGGSAGLAEPSIDNSLPVRWKKVGGQWLIEQLDSLNGSVRGGNAAGDLAGYVFVPCGSDNDCQRAVIWYAAGGFRQLGTLGGDDSAALDVNASGEVVGSSTSPRIGNTAFFWSQSAGMVQLPFKGRAAAAYSLSDVRADGTRVVVGARAGDSAVWVVRNP